MMPNPKDTFRTHTQYGVEYLDLTQTTADNFNTTFQQACFEVLGYHTIKSNPLHRYSVPQLMRNVDAMYGYFEENFPEFIRSKPGAELFKLLYSRKKEASDRLAKVITKDQIEFDDLTLYFNKDMEVYTIDDNEEIIAGIVISAKIEATFFSSRVAVELDVIHNTKHTADRGVYTANIQYFTGFAALKSLPIRMLDENTKVKLTERGKLFASLVDGTHYVQYTGQLTRSSWWSIRTYRADGRLMIDSWSFAQIDHDQFNNETRTLNIKNENNNPVQGNTKFFIIKPEDYWRTFPYLFGFSFRSKNWGKVKVTGITPIKWREDAYNKLVLPDDEKLMIRALVEYSGGSFSDLIEGKGGGCIFLLHGPPGQGKTLTAETIAELLHRPLYAITVGELGITPSELEKNLRTILDVATTWNAVVLLDEADIYLEARDENDIVRNAMVGVFLRLLEYHQGVLFLTTNRVKQIDQAFYSRVSIALNFEHGDEKKREKIWENLLSASGLNGVDAFVLAQYDINGRQIKNVIRLSQTLAKANNETVTTRSLQKIISLVTKFEEERRSNRED